MNQTNTSESLNNHFIFILFSFDNLPRWPNIHDGVFTFFFEGLLMAILSPKNDRFQLSALDLVEIFKKLFT